MSDKTNGQEVYLDADPVELPENAFRELAADETYRPLMHPARSYREATPYSVTLGLILAVIFSAAAAYLGLRVGQVFEAAIPIAIIAVGLSGALKKKDEKIGRRDSLSRLRICDLVDTPEAVDSAVVRSAAARWEAEGDEGEYENR